MHRRTHGIWGAATAVILLLCGCAHPVEAETHTVPPNALATEEQIQYENPTEHLEELEDSLFMVRAEGDCGFNAFLDQGGAASDAELAAFLARHLSPQLGALSGVAKRFGCSTISVAGPDGTRLLGRNFDWQACDALVVAAYPENAHASISTVNLDFLQIPGTQTLLESPELLAAAAAYAPLDGMNAAGLAVAVNMIDDNATIAQDAGKPDLTTTTAVRLLLNQASNVQEALDLLAQHDLHASAGLMIHYAISDAEGNSVAVEYVDNEMVVTDTPVLTNFYVADGPKRGIGTSESHQRFEILTDLLERERTMDGEQVRDALDAVSKHNFPTSATTEWSVVFLLDSQEATYYHRENFKHAYVFRIEEGM